MQALWQAWAHWYPVSLKKLGPAGPVDAWIPEILEDPLQPRLRHLSPKERATLESAIEAWSRQGIVEPSTAWVSCNPVFVEKKNGTIRTCIDYRPINRVTKDWEWPLPRIRDVRHRLAGTRWYTRFDLKDAFHRVTIPAAYRGWTAFHSHLGTFQFTRMPFGLKTAPATYQRFLDWVLFSHRGYLINYVDDILIFGSTRAQTSRRTRAVRETLAKWAITINEEKSVTLTKELTFVGLSITKGMTGCALPVIPFAAPHSLKDWQSALGFANCFRDYIPGFSDMTAGLYPGLRQ